MGGKLIHFFIIFFCGILVDNLEKDKKVTAYFFKFKLINYCNEASVNILAILLQYNNTVLIFSKVSFFFLHLYSWQI